MDYTPRFFLDNRLSASQSAAQIVPWLIDVLRPKNVVDVGCGLGAWLRTFQEAGVTDVIGVDGPWVPLDQLLIPQENFIGRNLTTADFFDQKRTFDLVLSLEVAEHLEPIYAAQFIAALTQLGPCVLFSAAAPSQGGIGHLNEQWPDYWINLFRACSFKCLDCVRGKFWENEQVAPWYAQNMLFFVREDRLEAYHALLVAEAEYSLGGRAVIHPRQYFRRIDELCDPYAYSIKKFSKVLPRLLVRAIARRFRLARHAKASKMCG